MPDDLSDSAEDEEAQALVGREEECPCIVVPANPDRRRHGNPPLVCHGESHSRQLGKCLGESRFEGFGIRRVPHEQLVILDDWKLERFDAQARDDFLEIHEERNGRQATIISSQLSVENWHQVIGDPISADIILHRVVHNAWRLPRANPR